MTVLYSGSSSVRLRGGDPVLGGRPLRKDVPAVKVWTAPSVGVPRLFVWYIGKPSPFEPGTSSLVPSKLIRGVIFLQRQ